MKLSKPQTLKVVIKHVGRPNQVASNQADVLVSSLSFTFKSNISFELSLLASSAIGGAENVGLFLIVWLLLTLGYSIKVYALFCHFFFEIKIV